MDTVDTTWRFGGLLVGLVALVLVVLGLALWVWALVHAIKNRGLTDGERIIWVLLIILVPLLGMILYFFIGRPKRPAGRPAG